MPEVHRPLRIDGPRERLLTVGVRHLSHRELLALLVGSGSRAGSVLDVADRLLAAGEGSIRRLGSMDARALEGLPGVGLGTAARVLSALELGRRAAASLAQAEDPIRGPGDVFARLGPRLRDLPQEEFHALLLNTRHRRMHESLMDRRNPRVAFNHPYYPNDPTRQAKRRIFRAESADLLHWPDVQPLILPDDRIDNPILVDTSPGIFVAFHHKIAATVLGRITHNFHHQIGTFWITMNVAGDALRAKIQNVRFSDCSRKQANR